MKWMYNTLTGGKTDMLPFFDGSALLKKKRRREGRDIVGKTRSVFDCVGARHRQDAYCTWKRISPLLLGEWINAGNRPPPPLPLRGIKS